MKKLFTIVLALLMALSLFACGGGKSTLTGTWTVDSTEVNGTKFTLSELEAMGDDSLSQAQLVIKDGGKAYMSEGNNGILVDWEKTDSGAIINNEVFTLVNGMLQFEMYEDEYVYFKKVSDSQEIMQSSNADDKQKTGTEDGKLKSTDTAFADYSDLEIEIETEVENTLAGLNAEWEELSVSVDGYQSYMENMEKIKDFYEKVYSTSQNLCIRMCEYSIEYAEAVLASGNSVDDMYLALEGIYDLIYDNMGDEIYDGIYDGILDEMYDVLYGNALDDKPDGVEYSEWSDARSDEYQMWSDTRADTYEQWSDYRSDVYGFWSDMRSEVFSGDFERANEKVSKFREKVEKMQGKAVAAEDAVTDETMAGASNANEVTPEFKEAMDSYEAFFDEYAEFMKKYSESDNPTAMLGDYSSMMTRYAETMEKLDEIDEDSLSAADALYYTEVMARINQKLMSVI